MTSYQLMREQRLRNIACMLEHGTVHLSGSVHEKALQSLPAPMESDDVPAPPFRTYSHQVEDVVCMGAVETRGGLPSEEHTVLTNVGVLGEPAGFGKMVTMAIHLATAPMPTPESEFVQRFDAERSLPTRQTYIEGKHAMRVFAMDNLRTYVPPAFLPITVIVVSHTTAMEWGTICKRAGLRVQVVGTSASLGAAAVALDASPLAFDVLVVSKSFCVRLAPHLLVKRVGRLVLDDVRGLGGRVEVGACFVCFIDDSPTALLEDGSALPTLVRNAFDTGCIRGMVDPSPLFVFHSDSEVDASIGLEYPIHRVYHTGMGRVEDRPPLSSILSPDPASIPARMVVGHHVPVWAREHAAHLVEPARKDRLVQQLADDEGCLVCTELEGGSPCLLTCCTRLLCHTCLWKILHTTAICPLCRTTLTDKGGSVVLISNELESPVNVAHFYPADRDADKLDNLMGLLHRLKPGARVLLYVHCHETWIESAQHYLADLLTLHADFHMVDFMGNAVHVRQQVAMFQSLVSTGGPRVGSVITSHTNATGLNLDATTDIIFYSMPSFAQYDRVLSRALNARSPMIERNGERLKVHFVAEDLSRMPPIKLSHIGGSIGHGAGGVGYEAAVLGDSF
jgi:hypothetical protein